MEKTETKQITSEKATSIKRQTNSKSNKLQQNKIPTKPTHFCSIDGPILFTAPHSARLYRGGKEYDTKLSIHGREKYTASLAMRFASKCSGSFCVWNYNKILSHKELDPNYMIESKLALSPFHQALHALQEKNKEMPLMHIDIHGKVNRKKNFNLDLGLVPMEVHWYDSESSFVKDFCDSLTKGFDKALEPCGELNGYKARCENEPALHGYWGNGIFTMTEQAIRLGIPSVQLEIPSSMRYRLFANKDLSDGLLNAIIQTYESVVVPWWVNRRIRLVYNPLISQSLEEIPSELKNGNYDLLLEAYERYEESKNSKEEF